MIDDKNDDPLPVVDSVGLTDIDWAAINKVKLAYRKGGKKALSKALDELSSDPVQTIRVLGAFFPIETCEEVRDKMAELGITREDLEELIRKHESPAHDQ